MLSVKVKFLAFVIFLFLQSSCGSFTNPLEGCFLDWNMNCIDKKSKELFDSGYRFSYPGEPERAKQIFLKCSSISQNIDKKERCLLENGFRRN